MKVHEGFSKFVIKKLKVFHGLFAIQFLKSLMCTRMQSQFLLMVFPFFILQISFYLLFFVENRTENYPELIFICKKNLKQVLYEKHSFDLIFTANYTLNDFSLKFYRNELVFYFKKKPKEIILICPKVNDSVLAMANVPLKNDKI